MISHHIFHKSILSTQRTLLLNYYFHTSSLPHFQTCQEKRLSASPGNVGKDGFEPPNSGENRFTVCCRWPLDYLPDGNHCLQPTGFLFRMLAWSQRRESNPRPADYKSAALPTELLWPDSIYHKYCIQRTKTDEFNRLFFWEGKGKRIC